MHSLNKAKKLFTEHGALSVSFIQRKFKLNFEGSCKFLEEIASKRSKKTYSGKFLIKIEK